MGIAFGRVITRKCQCGPIHLDPFLQILHTFVLPLIAVFMLVHFPTPGKGQTNETYYGTYNALQSICEGVCFIFHCVLKNECKFLQQKFHLLLSVWKFSQQSKTCIDASHLDELKHTISQLFSMPISPISIISTRLLFNSFLGQDLGLILSADIIRQLFTIFCQMLLWSVSMEGPAIFDRNIMEKNMSMMTFKLYHYSGFRIIHLEILTSFNCCFIFFMKA